MLVDVESGELQPRPREPRGRDRRRSGGPAGSTPRALLAVDLFGRPADYAALRPIARAHACFCCRTLPRASARAGASEPAGRQGDAAATSFYPSKPLGAYGDGGAVLTDDDRLAEEVRLLREPWRAPAGRRYDHVRIGLNSRLDTLQAAILLVKLGVLDEEIARRSALAARYDAALGDLVEVPPPVASGRSAWAQYTIQVNGRDRLAAALARRGIPTAIHYPRPLHRQPAIRAVPDGARRPAGGRAARGPRAQPADPSRPRARRPVPDHRCDPRSGRKRGLIPIGGGTT